jgi:hypothetical protein
MKDNRKLSEVIDDLKRIAKDNDLRINRIAEFMQAVVILDKEVIENETDLKIHYNKPIGICNRTNTYVYPTTTKGYTGYCPELDEDLFTFEFSKFNFKKQEDDSKN